MFFQTPIKERIKQETQSEKSNAFKVVRVEKISRN